MKFKYKQTLIILKLKAMGHMICNEHDVLNDTTINNNLITCQGTIKDIHLMHNNNLKIIMDDNSEFIVHKNNKNKKKLIKNKKLSCICSNDRKYLIDVLPPKIFTFYASVAGIFSITDEFPEHDIINLKNGTSVNIKRYEIIFIEGSPNKRVYVREDYYKNIDIGKYYSFECVVDEDRKCWYRVISVYPITDDDNEISNDAKIIHDRYYDK